MRWRVVLGSVVGVVALSLLVLGVRREWQRHEDGQLRQLLRAYPVPEGYARKELELTGGGCDINFACSRRLASVAIVKPNAFPLCDDLREGLRRWDGFRLERQEVRGTCEYHGEVHGRPAFARISETRAEGPAIVVYVSGSTRR